MESAKELDAHPAPGAVALSCQSCRKRKIRCDKQQPCSACVSAQRECVPVVRQRLPRGRNGGRRAVNTELRNRINRLEGLVQSLNHNILPDGVDAEHASGSVRARESQAPRSSNASFVKPDMNEPRDLPQGTTQWMGSTLWSQLAHEFNSIHTALEAEDEDDDGDLADLSSPSTATESSATPESLLFRTQGSSMPHVSDHMVQEFSRIYQRNVDPVMKFIHLPSFHRLLAMKEPYFGYPAEHPAVQAFTSAVFYTCICSIGNSQCLSTFGGMKESLREQWRQTTEHNLSRAEIITKPNLISLEALLMYIAALRSHENGKQSWILISLAVRMAQAIHLHREESYRTLTFIQDQLHRRAWYTLLALDYQAAYDRGSDLMIPENGYTTKPPAYIDDSTFPLDGTPPVKTEGVSPSMMFYAIHCESNKTLRQLNWVAPGDADRLPSPIQSSWEVRQEAIVEAQRRIQQNCLAYCKDDGILKFACTSFGDVLIKCMQLYAVRPLQRHPAMSLPPSGTVNLMLIATEALEVKQNLLGEMTEPWHWLIKGYVEWQSLAVLLAELCVEQQDHQLEQRAWKVASAAFESLQEMVAEGTHGPLWKPMRRLMRSAQRRRQGASAATPDSTTYLPPKDPNDLAAIYANMNVDMTALTEQQFNVPDWDEDIFDPIQGSWVNWQAFTDDLAQNNDFGWTSTGMDTVFSSF